MLLCCVRRNVENSYHTLRRRLPPSTNSAAYQWLVSSTCHGPSHLSVLHLPLQAYTARDEANYRAENRDFCLPHLHSTLPSEYCYDVQYRKTRMVCLPEMKKNWRYIYSFWQDPQTWQTDGQTDTTWRLHSIARQKCAKCIKGSRYSLDRFSRGFQRLV